MAALENGIGAVATASGQSAQFMAIATIVCPFSPVVEWVPLTALLARLAQVTTSLRGKYPFQLPGVPTEADLFL